MILTDDRDIQIDFTNALDGFVFDQMKSDRPKFHGVSEMNRVDLVVELDRFVAYVEIKDPEHPNARPRDVRKLLRKYESGDLAVSFAKKLMDSFVYGWAEEKALKPIRYYSLVTLESELVLPFGDEIAKHLPPLGRPGTSRWKRAFIENCQVFNLELWNECFPEWPAKRISQTETEAAEQQVD